MEARTAKAGLYMAFRHRNLRPIWLQTLVAINSKLWQGTFPNFCAPQSEVAADSNLSRWTSRRFRSAALHRIRVAICRFVPRPYVYSETKEWSNIARLGAKREFEVWTYDSDNSTVQSSLIWVDLQWSNFNLSDSGKMQWPIWQKWFCSVGCPEAIHWSHPSYSVERCLSWKFGVRTFFMR